MSASRKIGRANTQMRARDRVTGRSVSRRAGRAGGRMQATDILSAPPVSSEVIDSIRHKYRLAKTAEDTRNRLGSGIIAYVRTYASGWDPTATQAERKETAASAKRVVKHVLRSARSESWTRYPDVLAKADLTTDDQQMLQAVAPMILDVAGPWWLFEEQRDLNRHEAERLANALPAWRNLDHIKGFTIWGLVALIGEFGDLTDNFVPEAERKEGQRYSGVRRLYKRLGLAPDDCYPSGEKRTGRKIPRNTRGRIMGIIADTLLRHQWAGERGPDGEKLSESEKGGPKNKPAHPTGPYGLVYAEAKARQLMSGKSLGHADKLARRAMVKALIHDVYLGWHGRPLLYATRLDEAA
jgi:hypothetical protein